ncbi:MAG TPA: fibronectin type III domain-containing protein [Acidimicrobiales bacterium]
MPAVSTHGVVRLPGPPTAVTAIATDGQAVVRWAPPQLGGPTVSRYVVRSFPANAAVVVSGGRTRTVVDGLQNGEPVTFTVTAADSSGQGPPSARSNSVTPEPLSSFTSTVVIRSVDAMFNGGECVDQGTQCFGIQQNTFVQTAHDGEYWVQNLVFVEETVFGGWEAEGNYEIWGGTQQSIVACSGYIETGQQGSFCVWPMAWQPVSLPAHITLGSSVMNGDVVLTNSLGDAPSSWSPGPGQVQYIVDLHEVAVPSLLSLYAPETVIVGETGRHHVTFVGGSGSISSTMILANGEPADDTQCVAQSSDTSTGESSNGFYWTTPPGGGSSLVDFATHGGKPGDGDGLKALPGSQPCA